MAGPIVLLALLAIAGVQLVSSDGADATPTGRTALGPLLVEPTDGFGSVYSLISSATTSLDMVMYELNDPVAEHDLVSDDRRGVKVRVLLDRAYHGGTYNERAFAYLSSHGVPVRWAPAATIVHEKAIVVDDRRALIATFNLADTSDAYATTRDFGVFDALRPDVNSITSVFDADWAGRPIARPPAGDDGRDLVWSPGSQPQLVSVIAHARRSLLVENEEMGDAPVIDALVAAAHRGVDVEVVMTAASFSARGLDQLARGGVHVRASSFSADPYIHAKVIVADAGLPGAALFLGSENFSYASLDDNRELGLRTTDRPLIAGVARTVRADFAGGRRWVAGTR